MWFSFRLVLLCFLAIGCGPEERSLAEVALLQKEEQKLYYFEDAPFSGRLVDQTSSAIRIVYTVQQGVLYGPTNHYNEQGQLFLVENYTDGQLNGLVKAFFPNGKTQYAYQYVNGKKSGQQKLYYRSGQLKQLLFYTADRLTGDNFLYYEDGKLQRHFHFNTDGQRENVWEKFHPNGQLKETITYDKGTLISPIQRFDVNGNLINYIP